MRLVSVHRKILIEAVSYKSNCVMSWKIIVCFPIFLLILRCRPFGAYNVPKVNLNILDKLGFEVSLPDELGMQRVLYILQVDRKCPVILDYIIQATNGSWSSTHPISLHNNDKLQISVVVQYYELIYEKSETQVIINSRILTTQHSISRSIRYPSYKNLCLALSASKESFQICKPALSIVSNSKGTCHGELLFEDNFSDAQLNYSVWTHDIRQRMYHVEEELVAFEDLQRNSYVKEGHLYIVPTLASDVTQGAYKLGDRCTAVESPQVECNIPQGSFYKIKPPVYSAQVHTRKSFSFKYGKIVVRAKLPKGDWLFPYVMLQPVSTHAESHYAKQLRVAYVRGNLHLRSTLNDDLSGNRLYGGMVVWHQGQAKQIVKDRLSTSHYGNTFHNYTMIWRQEKITLMVDEEIYGELYDGLPYFNEKCFIIFGVTVGGFLNFDDSILTRGVKPYTNREPRAALSFWEKRDSWSSTWKNSSSMIIDYVRVYAE